MLNIFHCLFAICISPLAMFKFFVRFNGLLLSLLFSYENSGYILDMILYQICGLQVFFQSRGCLIISSMVSSRG